MISFIKLFPVIRFFLLQLMLGKVSRLCCLINMVLNFNDFSWIWVDICWGVFLGRRRVVFLFFMHFPFCCCAEYYLLRCPLLARHLAAESGIRTAASFVYFISAGGGWLAFWGGGGAFPGGLFAIFYSHQKVMISVIKFHWVGGLDELHGVNFFSLLFFFFYVFKVAVWMLRSLAWFFCCLDGFSS